MIFIVPILIIALGIFVINYFERWDNEGWHIFGALTSIVGGVTLFLMILGVWGQQMDTMSMHEKRDAIQMSYDHAREHGELETATIAKDIAEFNKDLAEYKYWNKSIWYGIFYHDSIEDVEPIN